MIARTNLNSADAATVQGAWIENANMEYRPVIRGKNQAGAVQIAARRSWPLQLMVVLFFALLGIATNPAHVRAEDIEVECFDPGGQELIDAINRANNNGEPDSINLGPGCAVIELDSAHAGSDSAFPEIMSEITINGNGATLRRGADATNFRLFRVAPTGNLTLNEVTLEGGTVDEYGGAIYNDRGVLTVRDSAVSDSTAAAGGGIYNDEGALTVRDSTISGNEALVGGGIASSGTLTVSNSTVSENAAGVVGGGIASNGTVAVSGSTIRANVAEGDLDGAGGGGIYHDRGVLIVSRSTIDGNEAGRDGGGILIMDTLEVSNSTIISNTAGTTGGGIHNSGDTVTVRDSTISGNWATEGGGIYNTGTLEVSNSTISRNETYEGETSGGGIVNFGTLTVSNSTISGNVAGAGGGIVNHEGTLTVSNSTISGNGAIWYGGISNSGTATLLFTTVFRNRAETDGGGISNFGAMELAHTILAGNIAGEVGNDCSGDITATGPNLIETDQGCTLSGPAAGQVITGSADLVPLQDNGGPTLTHAPLPNSPVIDAGSTTLDDPSTTDQRGRLRLSNGRADLGAVEVDFTCFATAMVDGLEKVFKSEDVGAVQDAIDDADSGSTVKVAGTCRGSYGLLRETVVGDSPSAINIDNDLTLQGGYTPDDWSSSDPLANPTTLDAAGQGRVVAILGGGHTVELDGLVLTNGEAVSGAGIYNDGGTLSVSQSTISGNSADAGGGIYNDGGRLTVSNSTISNNTAIGGGGIDSHGTLAVSNSTISDNEALDFGGGIQNSGTLTVTNSTISGNEVDEYAGGGIANEGQTTLHFTTLAENSAPSGGNVYQAEEGNSFKLFATILTQPGPGQLNCFVAAGAKALTSLGYNRISDGSCQLTADTDLENATIQLGELALNRGSTLNYLPKRSAENSILDVVPVTGEPGQDTCDSVLGGTPKDQRGSARPLLGFEGSTALCDVGSVEVGLEILTVCGPPLAATNPEQEAR